MNLLRHGRLGDVVLLGSVTSALPGCTVVTEPAYHPIAARLRGVQRVLTPEEARHLDVVDLQGSLRTRLRHPFAPRIHKHSLRRRWWLRFGGPSRPDVPTLYGRAVGVTPLPPPWIDLPPVHRDTLLLVPGAAWVPKRAPTHLLRAYADDWDGPITVLGGPGEEDLVERLAAEVQGRAVCERGFAATFEVLARAALTVAGDTGLLHLAGATGSPVIGVFGPTHPDDGFFVYPGRVQRVDLPCSPCALHRVSSCRRGDHACMENLRGRAPLRP